jgi:UDP-N-acetylmuramate-alanine ligase
MAAGIRRVARAGDVVLTMGAGSIGNVAAHMAASAIGNDMAAPAIRESTS